MDNPKKLATYDEEKQNKNTTPYVFDTTRLLIILTLISCSKIVGNRGQSDIDLVRQNKRHNTTSAN